MESTPAARTHRYLSRALPYEPPGTECHCTTPSVPCRIDLRANAVHSATTSGRSRPFPRSLGTHRAPTPAVVGPYAEPEIPEYVRRSVDQAMRLLLEVLDRRRTADQLRGLFTPTVIESIRTVVKTGPPGQRLGVASLRGVHLSRATNSATEIFATYVRGPRVFAIAARIESRSRPRREKWTVTSLRVL
ncbi:Rv3235 family protein [Rhodococcoides kyotonense]|uniref:Uncharacterized protein n=1 Tax=Rhodococcoides kyotonense TaxID=398843 RepID=A0A239LWM4_9NOCA|nr:Rv3235 family protein [Rhodococcus kyotonensis]SNT34024.1 hypothetical protein SAMN05421642_114116 [Rhodococcus kyotonensis]